MSEESKNDRRDFLVTAGGAAAAVAAFTAGGSAHAEDAVQLNSMQPNAEQLQEFMALPDGPIVMVNLLKFKPNGGAEEYAKYGVGVLPCLKSVGAEVVFSGTALCTLIGGAFWDQVALARYPDKTALIKMSQSPEYQAIHHHREAGLEGQINIAVSQNPIPGNL